MREEKREKVMGNYWEMIQDLMILDNQTREEEKATIVMILGNLNREWRMTIVKLIIIFEKVI